MSEINAYFMGRELRDYWSRGFVIGTRRYPRDRLPHSVITTSQRLATSSHGSSSDDRRASSARICITLGDPSLGLRPLTIKRSDTSETGSHARDEISMNCVAWFREPVMRVLRFTCRLDESRPPEIGEVSRNCRLRNSQNLDDVAHTQLSCGQTAQNAESRWIGESLE